MLGKIVAGLFGYMVYGPLGAILGVALGHQFDRGIGGFMVTLSPAKRTRVRESFFTTVFSLLGCLAKADGRISSSEIAHAEEMMGRMGLSADRRKQAIAFFQEGATPTFSIDTCLSRFMAVCGRHNNLKRQLLSYLIALALADGELHHAEEALLRKVSFQLGFPSALFDQLLTMLGAQAQFGGRAHYGSEHDDKASLAAAYAALGVAETSSDSSVKKTYKRLVSQNHPDKLIGQGMPEDMIKLATERTQEIQKAYELIVASRKSD